MIDKIVVDYVDHQRAKYNTISMAALVAKSNILKVINTTDISMDQLQKLNAVIEDLNFIMNKCEKDDFKC